MILALVTAGSGYANASQAAGAAAQPNQACTLKGSVHSPQHEWASCLQVKAEMVKAPEVCGAAPITFTIFAQQAQSGVQIEADLPGNLKWAAVPAGLSAQSVKSASRVDRGALNRASTVLSLKAGSTTTFTGSVTATGKGTAQIRIRAKHQTATGGVDAVEDSVFLTIGDRSSTLGIDTAGFQSTTPITSTPAQSQVPAARRQAVDMKPPAAAKGPGVQATSCVTGGWFYQDVTGAVRPSINMLVEAWEGGTRLTYGVTDFGGRYSLCFANVPGGRNVWVRFVTMNNLWRVRETGTPNDFVFNTGALHVADGANVEFGNLFPADPAFDRALSAFDSANTAWLWTPGYCWDDRDAPAACRQLVMNWSPSSTTGAYYDWTEVQLRAADPDSPILVVHEIGHFVMDDVYEDAYPPIPNCNPHSIHIQSSPGCAWSEGFAEWYPAQVFNDPFFRWPGGGFENLETPTWPTFGWDDGDQTEGRVAGALIDISDAANEAYWDGWTEGPNNIWNTFLDHVSHSFGQFWSHRAADGYNVADSGALAAVYQNTIDYGFRNPLGDYAELTRPTPSPSHNYGYNTWANYWSVVAMRPPAGADYDLELFDDRAQTVFLSGGYHGGNTVEFIATDSLRRPLGDYYPRAPLWSGTGEYQIELAQGTSELWTSETVTMLSSDVVVVRDVFLTAGVPTTLSVVPEPGQDGELFLMRSEAAAVTWIRSRSQAVASSTFGGPGATETFTYTPTASGWYGLVLINKAGSGKYTLSKS